MTTLTTSFRQETTEGKEDEEKLHRFDSSLAVDQGETRQITISEAIGLDFHSFTPRTDLSFQVHFISNVREGTPANAAGLIDGDRILQINGVNVTNLSHEDVRKLMQLITPIVFTVAQNPKYLRLLEQPVESVEEKPPELPPSLSSQESNSSKTRSSETFSLPLINESTDEESLKARRCRLRQSKNYDGYGLVLKYHQDLHVIGEVEEASPTYRAGLRENDVILFVGKTNVEKLTHDDVKVMIRAIAITSDYVEFIVLSKADIPKYKTLQEKGLIDWANLGLEK